MKKVDPTTMSQLITELQSPERPRIARALQIATSLEMIPDLFDNIVALLNDADQYTRLDAVRTLGGCPLDDSQQVLRRAPRSFASRKRRKSARAIRPAGGETPGEREYIAWAGRQKMN